MALLVGAGLAGQGLKVGLRAVGEANITEVAYVTSPTTCDLDGFELYFDRGTLALGAVADGKATALVFAGSGRLVVTPPNRVARQQARLFTVGAVFQLSFRAAVFRFADSGRLLAACAPAAQFHPGADSSLRRVLAKREKAARKAGRIAPIRILDAMADGARPLAWAAELLLAQFERSDGTWVHVDVDPLASQPLRVYTVRQVPVPMLGFGPGTLLWERFQDTWSEFAPAGVKSFPPPWGINDYALDLAFAGKSRLQLRETVTLVAHASHRGMVLWLDGKYRVQAVAAMGKPLAYLQAPDAARVRPETYAGGWLYLEWPAPVRAGQQVAVTLWLVNKNALQLGTRGGLQLWKWPDQDWYPVIPFGGATPRARFQVRIQKTGSARRLQFLTAHWGAGLPMTGFGLIESAKEAPRILRLAGGGQLELDLPAIHYKYDPPMWNTLADALEFYSAAFGALPVRNISLTRSGLDPPYDPVTGRQIYRPPGEFSNLPAFAWSRPAPRAGLNGRDAPSWPGLLMLDPRWAIDGYRGFPTGRSFSTAPGGGGPAGVLAGEFRPSRQELVEIVAAHIAAHQWWGDWVGWKSARDSWLGEALANGSANLAEEHEFGTAAAAAMRAAWSGELTHKDAFGQIPNSLGPLELGPWLASSLDPSGYDLLAQDKGGYVIEMLRAMMGEARFRAAMHDLTAHYGGRDISLAEFEHLMAAHMSPAMDLDHDGSLAWFFDEYVQHRAIDTLSAKTEAQPLAGGGVRVAVTIANPDHWRGLLPLYLMRTTTTGKRALLAVNGETRVRYEVTAPFKPVRIAADPWHEMLVGLSPRLK